LTHYREELRTKEENGDMSKFAQLGVRRFSALRSVCQSFDPFDTELIFRKRTTSQLIASAFVFKILANTAAVDAVISCMRTILVRDSPSLLKLFAENSIKMTILRFFSAGENFEECAHLARKLHRDESISTIADYSAEELDSETGFNSNLTKKINLLLSASGVSDNGIKFIPLKCTSLVDSRALERLTELIKQSENSADYRETYVRDYVASMDDDNKMKLLAGLVRFETICDAARANNISILLDAEQSNRQPAIEIIAQILSEKYNKKGLVPVVYNTYQTYLKRTIGALLRDMAMADSGKYVLAAKVVRGAYMQGELSAFAARQLTVLDKEEAPIWPSKSDTDLAYDRAIRMLLLSIASSGTVLDEFHNKPVVMIASHNRSSIESAVDIMRTLNIPNNHPNVQFAQILGMSDHITTSLANSGTS
jgi:proline dehydrogenase